MAYASKEKYIVNLPYFGGETRNWEIIYKNNHLGLGRYQSGKQVQWCVVHLPSLQKIPAPSSNYDIWKKQGETKKYLNYLSSLFKWQEWKTPQEKPEWAENARQAIQNYKGE